MPGVVYALHVNKPDTLDSRRGSRAVARAQGKLLDYSEWMDLCEATQTNETLRKLMNKLVTTYYLIKENK